MARLDCIFLWEEGMHEFSQGIPPGGACRAAMPDQAKVLFVCLDETGKGCVRTILGCGICDAVQRGEARHVIAWRSPQDAASFMFRNEPAALSATGSSDSVTVQPLLERAGELLLDQKPGQGLPLGRI